MLTIEEFGADLIRTQDLDPVYCALVRTPWDQAQRCRFLVAYWCFYHCGTAAALSELEGPALWAHALANLKTWPRARERRHFRGADAELSVRQLMARYETPEEMVQYIAGKGGTAHQVVNRAASHYLFGPWIGFKIADILERCLAIPVDFSGAVDLFTEQPRKAAALCAEERGVTSRDFIEYLERFFSNTSAPPRNDRVVNLQEVETILCKYKSMLNGHYLVGHDIQEIRQGLRNCLTYGWEGTAISEFLEAMPCTIS